MFRCHGWTLAAGALLGLLLFPIAARAQAPRAAAPRGPAPAVARTPGPAQAPSPRAPTAPFQLTVAQQAQLDDVLSAWRERSAGVKTMRADFTKFEYKNQSAGPGEDLLPLGKSLGQIKYAAPDQGYFRELEAFTWVGQSTGDAKQGRYEPSQQPGMYWVCDGRAVFEFDAAQKQLNEHRLPPEAQGKAIRQSPLPFLLGMDVEEMKERYWLREVDPPQSRETQVCIEAFPKYRQDAQNYQSARIVLTRETMVPAALKMVRPGGGGIEVYVIQNVRLNDPLQQFLSFFSAPRAPIGWEHVVVEPPAANSAQTPPPSGTPARGENASATRPITSPRR